MRATDESTPLLLRILDPVTSDITLIASSGTDAIVLDVEGEDAQLSGRDGMRRLLSAQRAIAVALEARSGVGPFPELHVLIGGTAGGYDLDHVRALCVPGLGAVHLPGADAPDHIAEVSTVLDLLEVAVGIPAGTVRLHPWIRTPRDVLGLGRSLCASARMSAPVIDTAVLARTLGIRDVARGLLTVRSQIVLESCANGVGAPLEHLAGIGHMPEDAARPMDPLMQIGFGGAVVR